MSAIALTQQDITRWIARSPAGSSQIWHNIELKDAPEGEAEPRSHQRDRRC